ncbi:MAG TPA: hypothetical protein VK772_13135 [Puia sp.]|jgi:hypothetical protein|nr:hypothetical protein [Puia sp.]
MPEFLTKILDWSEVWALFIPLLALMLKREQPRFLKPVIVYLWIALVLNFIGDTIGDFKVYLPHWLHSNNVLYNFHSLIRFFCFSYFFLLLGKNFKSPVNKLINFAALGFIIYNFIFLENFINFHHLSGNLLATEAYVLLIYCIQYYLFQLKTDTIDFKRKKDFWVVTGLSIYVVVNFFVFLFYVPMLTENPNLSEQMWSVHNLAYITLCIFIAKAFYVSA